MNISKDYYTTDNGKYYILENDQWIGKCIKTGKAWDYDKINLLLKHIPKDKIILDIGANIGTHSIPYSKHSLEVHSFEPQTIVYNLLKKNIKVNEVNNIKVYNMALGHKEMTISLSNKVSDGVSKGDKIRYDTDKEVNYGGIEVGVGGEEVMMRSLDSFEFKNVGFVKIDVEGCEKLVIYGGKKTFETNRPIVLYEDKKNISKEMRKSLNLSDKVLKFDILKFFIIKLKYSSFKRIGNDILFFP